jgi:general secretion pathway protein F
MADSRGKTTRRGVLSAEETGRLTEQVAGVARSGLPLGPGLRALGEELAEGGFRNSLGELADAIDGGSPLGAAMDLQEASIPPHVRGLVLGGLRTGKLGDVLGRFSSYARVGADLKRGLWLGIAYPLFTISLAFTLLVIVDLALVSQFEVIFRDFGIPLPKLTMALLHVSRVARMGWPAVMFFLGMAVVFYVFLRVAVPAPWRNTVLCRLPVVGPLWRFTSWAEFCHLLAILLESEVPLPEALVLTGQGVQDADIDRACRAMARDVEGGRSLSDAMTGRVALPEPSGPFDHLGRKEGSPEPPTMENLISAREGAAAIRRAMPGSLAKLLKWAESHRAIAEILHMAGEMFEARSRAQAAFAGTVMAVLAVVGVIMGIFVVVVGLFLPLVRVISRLSG